MSFFRLSFDLLAKATISIKTSTFPKPNAAIRSSHAGHDYDKISNIYMRDITFHVSPLHIVHYTNAAWEISNTAFF